MRIFKNCFWSFLILSVFAFPIFSSARAVDYIPNYQIVSDDILRSGRPSSQSDFRKLKQKGIKTIVSLENVSSVIAREKKWAEAEGLRFISKPMTVHAAPSDRFVNSVLETLNDRSLQPVLIHCLHGKDRTGLIIGLQRVEHMDWSADSAFREMLKYGFDTRYDELVDYFRERTDGRRYR